MATSQTMQNFIDYAKGAWGSVYDQLSDLGVKFLEMWEQSTILAKILSVMGIMAKDSDYHLTTSYPSEAQLGEVFDSDVIQFIVSKLVDDSCKLGFVFDALKAELKVVHVASDSTHHTLSFYDASADDSLIMAVNYDPTYYVAYSFLLFKRTIRLLDTNYDITYLAGEVCRSTSLYYGLSNICSLVANGLRGNLVSAYADLTSIIDGFKNCIPQYVDSIREAAINGPESLLNWMKSFLNPVAQAVQENDADIMFNSTSVVIRNFSTGVVWTTVSTVLQVASMALSFVSRAAAMLTYAAGVITQAVGRFIVSAGTEYDATLFKVNGSNQPHCFSFVVDQGVFNDTWLNNYMLSKGWTTMSVISCSTGSQIFLYKVKPDDVSDDSFGFEEHLSTDFDIINTVHKSQIGSSGTGRFRAAFVGDPTANYEAGYATPFFNFSGWAPQSGYTFPSFFGWGHPGQGGKTLKIPRTCEFYDDSFFSPIDWSIIDRIGDYFTEEIQITLKQRLLSSLFLWSYDRVLQALGSYTGYNANSVDCLFLEFATNFQLPLELTAGEFYYKLYQLIADMIFTGSPGSSWSYTVIPDLTDNEFDNLKGLLTRFFNVLAYHDISSDGQYVGVYACQANPTDDRFDGSLLTENKISDLERTEYVIWRNYFQQEWSKNEFVSLSWPKTFAVDLPSLTFSGFLRGLIIDGLIVAAAATVFVVGACAYVKVLNMRARLQAKAEAAWYKYQDSSSGEEAEAWRRYKAARLKYNVLAACTGGTFLNLGLYDEGTESSNGIIATVANRITGSSSDDPYTLDKVFKLIDSSYPR